MVANGQHDTHQPSGKEPVQGAVKLLEVLDNWAHVIVAAFFILMATTVILHMGFIFLRQIPLLVPASESQAVNRIPPPSGSETASRSGEANVPQPPMARNEPGAATPMDVHATTEQAVTAEHPAGDPFVKNSLELLSNILFVVILLELLRTIITYLETHDIQAIMQEFLVVGIISSVRKILLVGAEASLVGSKGVEFIQEATGVVINIIGIMLLIGGLVLLKRAFGNKTQKELKEA